MTRTQIESAILDIYNVLSEYEEIAGQCPTDLGSIDRPRVTHARRRAESERIVKIVVDSLKNP